MSSTSSLDYSKKEPVVTQGEKPYGTDRTLYEAQFDEWELEIINEHLDDRTVEECLTIINDAIKYHYNDPSLDVSYYNALTELADGHNADETEEEWTYRVKFEAFLIHEWSIYPAIRSVTHPIDIDDDTPVETFRTYFISIIISCAGSTLATFFEPRYPGISISTVALQVIIAYWGRLWSYLPVYSIPIGFGRRLHLGGGKWTYKEQMLATCGMSVGDSYAYSQDAVLAMANQYFFNNSNAQGDFGFSIMLTLSSNLMGFGIAGLYRTLLVYPVRYIWWGVLPTIRLSKALVEPEPKETINGWSISGMWVFWIAIIANFCWYWITNFVFNFFSYFNWITWINPNDNNNVVITDISSGMGYTPLGSLDPSLTGVGFMVSPYYSTVLQWLGMFLSGLVVIGMAYMNVSYTGYISANNASLHNRYGDTYNISRILNDNFELDAEKYEEYGMPFWSAGNLVSYGSFFAFYPAIIVYSLLEYGAYMWEGCVMFSKIVIGRGKGLDMLNDRFTRAQRKYKEVPEWWYMIALLICIGIGIATVEHYEFTETPVWTIFFGIGLSMIFMVPCGVLYAVTNTSMMINVLYELVIGLAIPGNGNALMIAKTYATNFMSESDSFLSNLKTGHYCNIPPRAMFRIQMINMIANSFVQAGLITWQSTPNSIPNMCSMENQATNKFICMDTRIYFNAAVQWGVIGPKRILRDLYPGMRYCFLFGALVPIPFWFVRHFGISYARRHNFGGLKAGGSKFRNLKIVRELISLEWFTYINEMIVLFGCMNWGSMSLGYITGNLYAGYFFAHYIPKHFPKWWAKYNYLIYAGTSVGITVAGIVVFFAVQYHNIPDFYWWGNTGYGEVNAEPIFDPSTLPNGFGPTTWRV